MLTFINGFDIKIQAVIISSITSLTIFILGWFIKSLNQRFSLKYKLKVEFYFEQKKKLKEEIAKNKIMLLNAAEELNHRLWNFSQHVDRNWHNIEENDWFKESKYYLNSFIYRFLVFIYWVIETEKSTLSIDTTIADKNDIRYLKFVKTLKDIFTDADLFDGLNYDNSHDLNHFFKNDLNGYCKSVISEDNIMDFDEFIKSKQNNYSDIIKIIKYFSNIQNSLDDKNLNVLKCAHLIIIQFLNIYGHDYQITPNKKLKNILLKYRSEIKIIENFNVFIRKSKLVKEMKYITKHLQN